MNGRPVSRRAVLGGLAAAALVPLARGRAPEAGAARSHGGPGGAPRATGPGDAAVLSSPGQMRGMWIASVNNTNWPSRTGLTAEQQKSEFTSWLDLAVSRRFNAVFVQVRPTADAFWPSRHEPWSQYLTGVQGRDPGYDPLAFMVEEAHARGLALHAWFNPYRVSLQPDPARLVPDHPLRRNPGWGVTYSGGLYYNPGLPEVRAFVQDAIMDAVTRYDVDGVHFDDYFYPYPVDGQEFDDAEAYARHGKGFADRAAWRRHNVDLLIHEMGRRVREEKPEAQWGISPFGIWRNAATDPLGSATSGSQSYDDQHADSRGWVRKGWLDYIVPQLYWNIGLPVADYAVLASWWAKAVAGTHTQLWIGQSVYNAGAPGQPAAWQDPAELSRHLTLNGDHPGIGGDVYYNSGDVRADRLGAMTRLQAEHYARPALGPVLPRLASGEPPRPPVVTGARRTSRSAELTFASEGRAEPRLYAVYRHDPDGTGHLLAVVPGGPGGRFTDPAWKAGSRYRVTAVDAANRQSAPTLWVS
ncbi:family 10 glycosylhydrolase [Sphaerisporangium sp. NBC_01403]|uniref:family 10 glycosylhydrolase n=1 Tax=Sphaerisporangium sp. NBC_01403 TaxID=2903599 RepID=UPI0032474663